VEHIKNVKQFGMDNVAVQFDNRTNPFFLFKSSVLTKDTSNENLEKNILNPAKLDLQIEILFCFANKKNTFIVEGDVIKFCFLPLSKVDLFVEYESVDKLSELSKTDSSVFCFQHVVEKKNVLFSGNSLDRSINLKQIVSLFEDQTTYVIKAEAFRDDSLLFVNFILTELVTSLPFEFVKYLETCDFYSYMDKN
jgi:hypothetical protein